MKRYPYQLTILALKTHDIKKVLKKVVHALNLDGIKANANVAGTGTASHWFLQIPIAEYMKKRIEAFSGADKTGIDFIIKDVDTDEVLVASKAKWVGKTITHGKIEESVALKIIRSTE